MPIPLMDFTQYNIQINDTTAFVTKFNAYLGDLEGLIPELNQVITDANTISAQVLEYRDDAQSAATTAANDAAAGVATQTSADAGAANQAKLDTQQLKSDVETLKGQAEQAVTDAQSVAAGNVFDDASTSVTKGWSSDKISIFVNEAVPDQVVQHYQEFTASGTWSKDPNATHVYVEAIGGGGSGGTTSNTAGYCCGGSGGSFASGLFLASILPASVSVAVGAGGAAQFSAANGNDGGGSFFGAFLKGLGGYGGTQSSSNSVRINVGGSASVENNSGSDLAFNPVAGPGGGWATPGVDTMFGGAGGGGGGGAQPGGVSAFGGDGGAGNRSYQGASGLAPGGGGGGGHTSGGSGKGGNGRVRVWQW